jgi:AcrR family transcriptional regulator
MSHVELPAPVHPYEGEDTRSYRTREALLHAFFALITARPLSSITVADIVERAGVGRSTFYEHFRGKDQLLAESLRKPLSPLAELIGGHGEVEAAKRFLEHVARNPRMVGAMVTGRIREKTEACLARMVFEQLTVVGAPGRGTGRALLAAQLSGGALAAVSQWLATGCVMETSDLANRLHRSALSIRSSWGLS